MRMIRIEANTTASIRIIRINSHIGIDTHMFTESIFTLSFAGIAFMLGSKLAEERFGKFHWWSKIALWSDRFVHEVSAAIVRKYRLYRKISYLFLFEFLPAYAYKKSGEFKDYVYKKYYASQSNLQGNKKMLRGNGSVSEFLQNITKEEAMQVEGNGGINE